MKRKWIKFISGLVASLVLTSTVGMQMPEAMSEKPLKNEVDIKEVAYSSAKALSIAPQGVVKQPKNEGTVHVKNQNESIKNANQLINKQVTPEVSRTKENNKYTMADLNSKSYDELVKILTNVKWNDITDLFQYNNDAVTFYKDSSRIQYLIDTLSQRGRTFTKDDTKGMPTIIEVLRAGFYLGFYNDGLKELNSRQYHDKCIPAILSIQKNPNFALGTTEQDDLVAAVGLLVNNASCNVEVVNNFVPILKQYDSNMASFIKDRGKGTAIYNIINGVQYDISGYIYETRGDYSKTPWNNKIDNFINVLSKWALIGNLNTDNEWLVNNCIFYISSLGKVHSNNKEGQRVLTEATKVYPYLSEQYVQAAFALKDDYDSKDYYGNTIDVAKIKKDMTKKYLPKEYSFDDGKVLIKAGDRVAEDKVKKLYWASKEVQSQFFRNLGSDKSLEQGNADDVLTIVIYNSPEEYKVNRLLNGLDVNNGGIYIESTGTFYTYERTVEESIYTLEELFRHEFTHYLQGRYMVPGMWGNGAMYENGRLTWLEEGGAEFFAGSTRTSGILPRKAVVSNVVGVNENDWYSADKTMHSKYGSFEFYHYGFMLQSYFYNKDFVKIFDLMQSVKNNNVAKYDDLISSYSSDSNLENGYDNYIKSLVNNYDKLTTPLVAEDYLKNHDKKNALEVYSDITKVANLKNVKTEVKKSQFFNSFKLEGTFEGGKSQGKINDLKNMDKKVDGFLNTLSGYSWSGYKTLTAYMVDYNVDSNNNVTWRVVFGGMLTDDGQTPNNANPVAVINGPYSGKVNEAIKFSSKDSSDKDGQIVKYTWDFGDGTLSNEENPSHKYNKEGIYTLKLTVTDDKGAIDSKETEVKISKDNVDPTSDRESESNDDFNSANVYRVSNKVVKGSVSEVDKDIFSFEVKEDGDVDVSLSNYNNKGINWIVYKESDTDNYFAYPQTSGSELKGNFKAKKGKYYLVVYSYDNGEASYGLKINGNIGEKNTGGLFEKEDNNSFNTANNLDVNSIVMGTLDEKDNSDVYSFDVNEEGNFEIVLDRASKQSGFAWLLFNENDLKKYISYPKQAVENKLLSTQKLAKGKYYIKVYRYEGNGEYSISVANK